jgi:hypothetical protein
MKGKGTREGSKGKERVVGGRVKGMSGLPQASDIQKWSGRREAPSLTRLLTETLLTRHRLSGTRAYPIAEYGIVTLP